MPKTCLVLPDIHFGFSGDETIHDELALQAVLDFATRHKPQTVIMLGDCLDLAGWSLKFPAGPELRGRTRQAIDAYKTFLGGLRAVCGPLTAIHMLEGNHEARIAKLLSSMAPEALGLGLDIPTLCDLKAYNVTYHGPYPMGRIWLWDRVLVQHGSVVRKGGGRTVAGLLDALAVNQVCGHIHRLELAGRTVHGPKGPETFWACSPGTLSKVGHPVPGADYPDWQQGCLWIREDKGSISMHPMPIVNGVVKAPWSYRP
jgi:hypothetical protein